MAKNVVWSPLHMLDEKGKLNIIKCGETVSANDVGGKEALEELRAAGAVRDFDYPDTNPYESPREANLRKLNEMMADAEASAYDNIDFNVNAPEEPTAVEEKKASATS